MLLGFIAHILQMHVHLVWLDIWLRDNITFLIWNKLLLAHRILIIIALPIFILFERVSVVWIEVILAGWAWDNIVGFFLVVLLLVLSWVWLLLILGLTIVRLVWLWLLDVLLSACLWLVLLLLHILLFGPVTILLADQLLLHINLIKNIASSTWIMKLLSCDQLWIDVWQYWLTWECIVLVVVLRWASLVL